MLDAETLDRFRKDGAVVLRAALSPQELNIVEDRKSTRLNSSHVRLDRKSVV